LFKREREKMKGWGLVKDGRERREKEEGEFVYV
jgi:hypothetical protein